MNDDLLDALVFLKHNDKKNPRKRPSKFQTPSKPQAKESEVGYTPVISKSQANPRVSQASESPRTPNNKAATIRCTPGNSRSQSRMSQADCTSNDETPKSSKSNVRFRQSHKDLNMTISSDPVIVKRGRVEHLFSQLGKSTKKSRAEITPVVVDDDSDIDFDETQIEFNNQNPKSVFGNESVDQDETQIYRSQATPRTRTIRCVAGTSRSQSNQRGSMFQAPQPSNSVFSLRSTRQDANETISLDPAIKGRGQAQKFDETFFEDSDNF